jgi:hypothetical protein
MIEEGWRWAIPWHMQGRVVLIINDTQMTHRNFHLLRVLGSALRLKAEVDLSSRGHKDLFVEKRKAAWAMQWDLETSGSMDQIGN